MRADAPNGTVRPQFAAGFTILEILVYLVFGAMVVAATHAIMTKQQRDSWRQKEILTSQNNLRRAITLLTTELRNPSAEDGDLYSITKDSISFRSTIGVGVVCARVNGASEPTYTIGQVGGEFASQTEDSLIVRLQNGSWRVLKTLKALSAGPYTCSWGAAIKGPYRLEVAGDTSNIPIGAPVRGFRRISYQLVSHKGEWWLARRIGAQAAQPLVGPFQAPAGGGLELSYLDENLNPTTVPTDVAGVEIVMRSRRVVRPEGTVRTDSLRTRVALRN